MTPAAPPQSSSDPRPAQPASARAENELPRRVLLGCALGAIPEKIGVEGVKNLANPIYNVLLGVNPALIGTMLMLARIWDAVSDVVMGSVSDNTRSRWGRRRPYILAGAILGGLCYPLIWFVPRDFSSEAAAVYFLCTVLLFYTAFTIFYVPFFTLSLELTPDHTQRTKISGALMLTGAVASLAITWAFRAAQWDIFPDPITGIRTIGIVFGAAFLLFGLGPVFFGRERFQAQIQRQPKQKVLTNLKVALAARPFQILMGMTVLIILGAMSFSSLATYVNIYYVFGGDTKRGATLVGLTGTMYFVLAWIVVPLISRAARLHGKDRVLTFCLVAGMCTGLTKWLCYDTRYPYLQLVDPLIAILPGTGFWVLVNAMKADICDWDELRSGMRREGAFASASTWLQKFSSALTFTLTGVFLVVIGFDQARGGEQYPETITRLRLGFILAPVVVFGLALLILRAYPLTSARMTEIRAELERRRGQI